MRSPVHHLAAASSPLRWLTPLAAAMALGACGGGGGEPMSAALPQALPTTPAAPATVAAVVFSGVAATGAALPGASVKVFGAAGDEACSTTTDDQGAYRCTLSAASQAPFTVIARLGEQALYSSAAVAASGTVNVTPLTTLIVSRLSPSGDPAKIVDEIKVDPSLANAARLSSRVAEVQAMIAPLTAAAGNAIDPIHGVFAADGSGHDKVLDSLQISIRPDGNNSNVQVTIKTTPTSDAAAPLTITFRSNEATPAAPAVTIRPGDLIDDGIAGRIAGFFGRMTGCYAMPLNQRIANVAAGTVNAVGTAASVQAEVCRGLFIDDNPAAYKENGKPVASNGNFAGLFRDSSTGAAFDRGNFEYRFANGDDVFVTFRSTTRAGVIGHAALVLRQQGGKLKAVGNQYEHEAFVRPIAFDREFPLQPQYSYFGTGYNLSISNRVDAITGAMVYAKAVVTTPAGKTLTLKPVAGRSSMVLVQPDGSLSGTGVQFFAAAFKEASTAGNPADKDGASMVFANPQRSDDELRAIPDQGVWTVEWVHADPEKPKVVQSYRTTGRAPTLGEIRSLKMAQFSAALKAAWLDRDDVKAFSGMVFDLPSASTPSFVDLSTAIGGEGWTVPDGALFPFSVSAFGRAADGSRFNDSLSVLSTDRSGRIGCSKLSAGDTHCDSSTGTVQFAQGARVWTMELYSRTLRQLELVKALAFYPVRD